VRSSSVPRLPLFSAFPFHSTNSLHDVCSCCCTGQEGPGEDQHGGGFPPRRNLSRGVEDHRSADRACQAPSPGQHARMHQAAACMRAGCAGCAMCVYESLTHRSLCVHPPSTHDVAHFRPSAAALHRRRTVPSSSSAAAISPANRTRASRSLSRSRTPVSSMSSHACRRSRVRRRNAARHRTTPQPAHDHWIHAAASTRCRTRRDPTALESRVAA
jgi:hypothetical protein